MMICRVKLRRTSQIREIWSFHHQISSLISRLRSLYRKLTSPAINTKRISKSSLALLKWMTKLHRQVHKKLEKLLQINCIQKAILDKSSSETAKETLCHSATLCKSMAKWTCWLVSWLLRISTGKAGILRKTHVIGSNLTMSCRVRGWRLCKTSQLMRVQGFFTKWMPISSISGTTRWVF